jgi:hypothetical protein
MSTHVSVCEHPLNGAASASHSRLVKTLHNEDGVWLLLPEESFSLDDRAALSLYASQSHGQTSVEQKNDDNIVDGNDDIVETSEPGDGDTFQALVCCCLFVCVLLGALLVG